MSFSFDSLKGFLIKTAFVFFFCLRQWLSPVSPQKQELLAVENTNSICRPEVVGVLRFQATKKVKFFHPIFYRHIHGVWCKLTKTKNRVLTLTHLLVARLEAIHLKLTYFAWMCQLKMALEQIQVVILLEGAKKEIFHILIIGLAWFCALFCAHK